jgi:hypothetical protein|tara:strand:+ start:560 stop:841 length:282 start_codon:yes stop_codon:yes gene_type:complete
MEYKVLGGTWNKSEQPTKEELVLMKIYELESLHFINSMGEPSKLKHPNEHAQWKMQHDTIEETLRVFELNLDNMDIVLDELIESYVSFEREED